MFAGQLPAGTQPQVKPPEPQPAGGQAGAPEEDGAPMEGTETCLGELFPQAGQGASLSMERVMRSKRRWQLLQKNSKIGMATSLSLE